MSGRGRLDYAVAAITQGDGRSRAPLRVSKIRHVTLNGRRVPVTEGYVRFFKRALGFVTGGRHLGRQQGPKPRAPRRQDRVSHEQLGFYRLYCRRPRAGSLFA